jgi:hypothetical protein
VGLHGRGDQGIDHHDDDLGDRVAEPTVEVVMYFTGLSPDARVRAAALLGITARVMAKTEVARAKMR